MASGNYNIDMSSRHCLLKLIVALCLLLSALPGQSLTLTKNESIYQLSAEVSLLEDPTGELSLAEVSSPKFQRKFHPWPHAGDINLGFSESAYWLKLTISRDEDALPNWLIEIPHLGLENIEFYAPDQLPVLTGSAHRFFLFPITITT